MNRYKIKLNLELTAHAKNFTLINIIITITHISIYFFRSYWEPRCPALHTSSHLIITTTLCSRSYFLRFTVKTEAQSVNDLPETMHFASSEAAVQTRSVKPRPAGPLSLCSWPGSAVVLDRSLQVDFLCC